jgi:hypothetical protein
MLKRMFGPWRLRRAAGAADDTTPVVLALDVTTGFTSGGDAVTITGLNFRGDGSGTPPIVRFGTVQATSVVVVDRQTITCNTPAYGTTGVVAVSVRCGSQIDTLSNAFTYYETVVLSVSPSFGTTMGSTRVLLAGRNFVDGSVILVGGGFAQNVVFVDAEHYSFVTPAHAMGVGDIIITDPAGRITTVRNGFKWTTLGRGGDIRRSPGVSIRETLGNSPNTATFVIDGQSNLPTEGEVVQIVDGQDSNRLLFAGFAQTVSEAYEGQTDQLAYQIDAVDYTPKLNRKRPVATYNNVSASEVVIDLVARFAPGFTTSHVQLGLDPVTVSFDGTQDFTTCLSEVCAHARAKWKVDYVKDVHVFTSTSAVKKPATPLTTPSPTPSVPQPLTAYMTVAAVQTYPGFTYPAGYYLFRHTFVWADGAESALQSCADVVQGDGNGQFYFTNVPLGTDRPFAATASYSFLQKGGGTPDSGTNFKDGDTVTIGSITYVFQDILTDVPGHVKIGANGNETLDKLMFATQRDTVVGVPGVDYADSTTANPDAFLWSWDLETRLCKALVPGVAGDAIVVSANTADPDCSWFGEGTIPWGHLILGSDAGVIACTARRIYYSWLGDTGASLAHANKFCQVNDNTTTEFTTLFGQAGSGDALAVPIATANPLPYVAFAGPYPAPLVAPTVAAVLSSNGIGRAWVNFRTAYLYRDGTYSWSSPATTSVGTASNSDLSISGFSFTGITPGPTVGSLDVLARLVFMSIGAVVGTEATLYAEPNWTPASIMAGLLVVPGNTTQTLETTWPVPTIGIGNYPYLQITPPVVVDLENLDAVGDLVDTNPDLLHADSGSQPFTVTRDVSQLRNRIFIVGASTTVAVDCPDGNPTKGKTLTTPRTGPPPGSLPDPKARWSQPQTGTDFDAHYLQLADGSFLPSTGGVVRMTDAKSLKVTTWNCKGVYPALPSGRSVVPDLVVGRDVILDCPEFTVAAGSALSRFFQYDDAESQAYMMTVEPDTDGIYEYTIVDNSLVTNEQMQARALAEAEMYAWPIITIRYATRDKKTVAGKTVHVNMTSPPCVGDFIIQDVTIDQIHDESDQLTPRYTVTASSMRMDLVDLLMALTKPEPKVVTHVPVLPQIYSVKPSILYPNYLELTGTGFSKGIKVFFDGAEADDVVVD